MSPIKREEIIGPCRLLLGDCLRVMPELDLFDGVISDPPYGIGFTYDTHKDDPAAYPAMMQAVIAEAERLRSSGPAVFWQAMSNADKWHEWFPPGFRIYAACKGFVQSRPIPVQYSWDPVVFWGKPDLTPSVWRKDWSIQRIAPFGAGRERVGHPCPRPVEQTMDVVSTFSDVGHHILDPFMGSGTTGVACVKLGRRFTGIEIDETYFDIACERIRKAVAQPDMFVSQPDAPQPKQEALL